MTPPQAGLRRLSSLLRTPIPWVLLAWLLVMGLLQHLLLQARDTLEHEAAQRAQTSAQALAARFDGLFAQSRDWAEELSRVVTPAELLDPGVPSAARLAEVGLWVDDLRRRNPQLAHIGILDASGRSFRARGQGGSDLDLADSATWRSLVAQGAAGRGRVLSSAVHDLKTTGKPGIVHVHGLYADDGRLAGAVVIGLHLDELERHLQGLQGGGSGAAALVDLDYRLIVHNPQLRSATARQMWVPRDPGPLTGTYRVVSNIDGKARLGAVVPLQQAPYIASIGLAAEDYLAGWFTYRRDIGLAMTALSVAAGLLVLLLLRNQQAQQALAQTEGVLETTLEMLPSACLHAGGQPLRVLHANAAAHSLLGLSADERPLLSALFDDPQAAEAQLGAALGATDPAPLDLRLRRGEERFWATLQLRARPDGESLLVSILDIEARRQREDELLRQSGTDVLTGLANRRAFYGFAGQLMAHCRRQGEPMAVLMIDLDHFKAINDRFGHPGGDAVLRAVAARLQAQRRGGDVVARIGGEEFALLLPSTSLEAAETAARRLLQHLRAPAVELSAGIALQVTASIGVAAWLPDEDDIDWALARADAALYRAKAQGRDRYDLER